MTTFNTVVEFVLGQNPTPEPTPGGWTPTQTGDFISTALILLFVLVSLGSMAYLLYSRKKVGVSYGGYFKTTGKNALTRLNKIAIGVCIGAFVALLAVVAFSGVNKAIAADKEADETIKAYVDVESGTVTCDVATIVNNSENTVYIASTQVDLTDEAKEVLKDSTFNLKIQSDDLETTLYDKEVPGVMDEIKSLPFESKQSVKASLTITNLDFATAKLLIGKKVLDITFAEKDCWSVVYNSNGAQSGTTPSPQIKEAGKALTLASKPDFVKEGYTLQDYWTTDPADGASATHYNFGAEYTDDANLTLYAAWTPNPVPGKYNVTFTCSEGGSITSGSDFSADEGVEYAYKDIATSATEHSLEFKTNESDDSHVITVKASENYKFDKWTVNGAAVTQGKISSSTAFVANFIYVAPPLTDIKVTYKIYNTIFVNGNVQLLKSGSSPDVSVYEEVKVSEQNYQGAKAIELEDNEDSRLDYFWYHWTMEGVDDWSYDGKELTKDVISAKFGTLSEDVTFIAHFVTPVAKYTESNSTMIFSCDDYADEDDNFIFPVNNTHWDDNFDGTSETLGLLTLPSWCNYDGTQKVYPRTVKFLESFKAYKTLTSTSLWFNSQYLLRNEATAVISEESPSYSQKRVLTNISGLENIYTENIEETAMMFSCSYDNRSKDLLTSIDLSSWNLCPKDSNGNYKPINMNSMFSCCSGLETIKLPAETEGHYFATNASNLAYMLDDCISLSKISLNGSFGANATTIHGLFGWCNNLLNININEDFGAKAKDVGYLFADCNKLKEINLPANFGAVATNLDNVFSDCYELLNINFAEGSKFGMASQTSENFRCDHMCIECYKLRSIDLSNFKIPNSYTPENMFVDANDISEFKISDKWEVNMSDVGMHGVDDSNKWVKDYTGGSYATEAIPGSSGAGIFVLTTPKAIYNPTDSTFTFVYDSADHSEEVKAGSTIFPVYEKTGYVTGMIQEDIDDYSAYRLMGDTLASFVVNAGGEVLPFRPHQLGRVSQAEYYDISNLDLPSWYYLDTEAYKIECMIKNDVTVIFDSSFSMCKDIYSTSCWFMADSDGNAPFTQFKSRINGKLVDGFTNIPTNNLQSCSSMFGGFCYEAYKHHNYWYNGSDSDIPLSDPWRILPASNTGNVFVSSFLDTYNYKLSTLDLSTFNISNMNVIDYGAICANCKGLTTVTLPSRFIQPSQEDNNFDYPGTRGDYISFSAAFYGCEKLENVTNIQKFNPFTIMSKNKTFGSYSIGRMFYGCKSLKSIDLSCFDVDNYIGYSGLGYSAMYRYEDVFCGCEMLNQIKLGNGWDLPMSTYLEKTKGESNNRNISMCANLPAYDSADIFWTFTPNDTSLPPVTDLPTYAIPIRDDKSISDYPAGTYVRSDSSVSTLLKTITISPDDENKGNVSQDSYTFYNSSYSSANENVVEISCSNNILWIEDTRIVATPKEGYIFTYWTLDGQIFDSSNDQYVNKSSSIVAHFMRSDYTAKAVYQKNNSAYDGHNTLSFYFDNIDHNSEGDVYEVNSSFVDTSSRYVNLPSWYTLTYVASSDSWASKFKEGKQQQIGSISEYIRHIDATMMDYNPYYSARIYSVLSTQYSSLWRIQTLVEPEDVVFDKSFKDYTQLQSISMWFMADMFGTQTVKNFYSPTDSNPKNPGFANMFTGNLTDVSYAFGGLFQEVNALPNMLMPTQELTNSVFDETKDVVLNQLWSNDYETYGTSLENIDLTGFDFSNIKDMSYMFANCVSLKNIKFDSNLDTSRNLYNMGTFANCENLGPVFSNSVQNWDKFTTENVAFFDEMFYGCSGIVELDLSKFNTDKAVCNPNFEDLYNGNISAPGMFSECTRLTKINVHSEYDDDSYYNITGFSLNLGESGLANCNGDNVVWKNDGDTSWQETDSSYRIPYNSNIIWEGSDLSEGNIHTGTFYRSQNFDEKRVEVVSNDTSKGTVSEDGYGYINNVQIMLNNLESNSINLDNRKITATAKDENSRFAYWKIQIGDEDEFTMPNGYCETFFADDDLEITITAVFVSNEENGYVAFSNHQNGDKKEGTFTFYYGTADEASDFVPEGDTFVEVYPVYNNTSDYNLPSWYRKYQESWISGDNHPIPKFVNKVESNADTIFVNFDSSFKNFDELRSMSCWFMGALSATNEAVLYNPFALDSAEHFSGLDNINTSNIDNVAYMFGGSEFFNEIHGSKNETIYLKDFDKEGNIRNLSGIFANLPRLTNLTVDNCFNGMTKVTSTSKMFYNTIKLEKSNLNWLKTQNVEDMSYMFGNSVDGKPKEKLVEDNPFTLTLPENFVFSDNLYNLEGMFSGYAIYPKLIVDFSKIHTSENKVIRKANMSHMFQNCYWISSIEFKGTVPEIFSRGTDMSYMYKNCSNIKKATNGNDSAIPVPLQCVAYVINFNNMFDGCTSLEDYSLTREDKDFDIEYMQYMFSGCTSLKTVSLDSGYYWDKSCSGPALMFNNTDGTLNTTLEHFSFDRDNWYDDISFYDCGLSLFVDDSAGSSQLNPLIPITWVRQSDLSYATPLNLPIDDSEDNNDVSNIETYDRATTNIRVANCYSFYGYNWESTDWHETALRCVDVGYYQIIYYIGIPEGYSLKVKYVDEEPAYDEVFTYVEFVLSNPDNSKSHYYRIGQYYDEGTTDPHDWTLHDVDGKVQDYKLTSEYKTITAGSNYCIYYPYVPYEVQPRLFSENASNDNYIDNNLDQNDAYAEEVAVADEAMPAGETAFETMASPDVSAVEVATAAMSILTMPLPIQFFSLLIEILI